MGALASFATMFAGATGPLIAPFIGVHDGPDDDHHPCRFHVVAAWREDPGIRLPRIAFAPYALLMILMILFGMVGTWSGKFIRLMAENVFRWGFNLVLTVLAIRLLFKAGLEIAAD